MTIDGSSASYLFPASHCSFPCIIFVSSRPLMVPLHYILLLTARDGSSASYLFPRQLGMLLVVDVAFDECVSESASESEDGTEDILCICTCV